MPQQWQIIITLTVQGNDATMATRRDDLKSQVTAYKTGKTDITNATLQVDSKGFQPESYTL